jgi:hypothetical protein
MPRTRTDEIKTHAVSPVFIMTVTSFIIVYRDLRCRSRLAHRASGERPRPSMIPFERYQSKEDANQLLLFK